MDGSPLLPPDETARFVGEDDRWAAVLRRDPAADLALQKPEIIKAAVDAKIVPHTASIAGAKIVALFPPMTGG